MSIQAVGWAFDQPIPSRAKLLLVALANHADHTSGYCWPSVETLMRETSMSRRAVFGYLGALRRNGYLDIKTAHGKDGRQRSNNYWILFDREPAEWLHLKKGEEEDPEENSSTPEVPPELETKYAPLPGNVAETIPAPPQDNSCTPIKEPSDSNRQSPQLRDGQTLRPTRPKDFSPQRRVTHQATEKAQPIGVIQGSKPWDAWVRHGHPPTLVGNVGVNGNRHRGWYFPTLYPPKATGPPPNPTMTEADEEELSQKWG